MDQVWFLNMKKKNLHLLLLQLLVSYSQPQLLKNLNKRQPQVLLVSYNNLLQQINQQLKLHQPLVSISLIKLLNQNQKMKKKNQNQVLDLYD
jgi:hypothetical protein